MSRSKQASVGCDNDPLDIVRVCTGWEISQPRKTRWLKSESFGQTKTREEQALSMVDRAGFQPSWLNLEDSGN
jgi:hypothetical protein